MLGFYGRLGRLGYVLFLAFIGGFYCLGAWMLSGSWQMISQNAFSLANIPAFFLFWIGGGLFWLSFLILWGATVRRLHDMDLSGWWSIAVYLFPVCLLVLCLWPGTRRVNEYGYPL